MKIGLTAMKQLIAGIVLAFVFTSAQSAYAQNIQAGSWGGKVRAGPGVEYEQVGSTQNGDPVVLLQNTGVMFNGYPWFRITFAGGQTGYQWGGILCGYGREVPGAFQICDRDNRQVSKPNPPIKNAACANESIMRSVSGDVATNIRFQVVGENDETQFKIYWIDYNGRRKFYKHIFAGDRYTQPTFLTHPWVVTAPVPGGGEDCVAVYLPRQDDSVIVLK